MSQVRDLDATKRDRFELLSAYLDGEVSPEERRLVASWLTNDPEVQSLYRRLLSLRQGFQGLRHKHGLSERQEVPTEAILCQIDRRFRLTCMAGMTAAAAALLAILSSTLTGSTFRWIPLQADLPTGGDTLQIALDRPPISIPKPAIVTDSATDALWQEDEGGTVPVESSL